VRRLRCAGGVVFNKLSAAGILRGKGGAPGLLHPPAFKSAWPSCQRKAESRGATIPRSCKSRINSTAATVPARVCEIAESTSLRASSLGIDGRKSGIANGQNHSAALELCESRRARQMKGSASLLK
jgi:hypothetical protein